MGLDNIPMVYPCRKNGTAVMLPMLDHQEQPILGDDGLPQERISCGMTQVEGGCSWQNANPPEKGRVYGMLGTDCWYRGKYGETLLREVSLHKECTGVDNTFYGNLNDGTVKTPESCADLASEIDWCLEQEPAVDEEVLDGLRYASWYMRWAAEECGGLECWY